MAQTYFDSQIIMCLTRRAQSWSSSPWGRAVYLGIHIQGTLSNDLDQVTVSFSLPGPGLKSILATGGSAFGLGHSPLCFSSKFSNTSF